MTILPREAKAVAILPIFKHDWLKWSVVTWQVWYAQEDNG